MTPKPNTECELSKLQKKFLENRAHKKYTEAQAYLVRKIPMLGIPLLETLPSVMSYNVKAMATDGTCIVYNPEWVVKQPMLELVHIIAHEVAHVAFKHMTRRKNRDQKLWNVATDYQVNSYLHLMGVGQKPKNCLYEDNYNGMTMTSDAIYDHLLEDNEPEESPDNKQEDDNSESSCGSGNTPH
ncbi:MAG: hypothetical protein QF535_15370, partial [Anaerolineales bacterium]|nr:hypothetical protein [Anaerolineales bacterium]